jgi:hypothetical protein
MISKLKKYINIDNNSSFGADSFIAALKRKNLSSPQITKVNVTGSNERFQINQYDELFPAEPSFFNINRKQIYFTIPTHYETKIEIANTFGTASSADNFFRATFNLEYNFLIKEYENFLTTASVSREPGLPNFYEILREETKKPLQVYDSAKIFENKNYLTLLNNNSGSSRQQINQITGSKTDIIGATKISNFFKKFNPFKEQFPFYTEIQFNNHPLPKEEQYFSKFFDEYNLYPELFSYITGTAARTIATPLLELFESQDIPSPTPPTKNIKEININNFIRIKYLIGSRAFAVGENTVRNNLEEISKIQAILNDPKNKLTYEKIVNFEKNYSEVIGYKISKFDSFGPNANPIQNFYIPITEELTTEFIDSQIKYDKKYRYLISSLILVYYPTYFYSKEDKISFVTISPNISIFEIPSAEYTGFIFDSPPVEPETEIIPYVGISNKIKININTGIGKKLEEPVYFNELEKTRIDKIKQAQNRNDNKILFQSDEPSEYFEMYVLQTPPKTYADFLSGQKYIIQTNGSSAGSTELMINQNTTYYLTFRSFDFHGNFSNPSIVQSVQLVNDAGSIYSIIEAYDTSIFDSKLCNVKSFKRLLSVEPNIKNTIFDRTLNPSFTGSDELLQNSKLGNSTQSIWDKKIKMRVTSKSSGRKIDINMVFNINREK